MSDESTFGLFLKVPTLKLLVGVCLPSPKATTYHSLYPVTDALIAESKTELVTTHPSSFRTTFTALSILQYLGPTGMLAPSSCLSF
ncbi:hypothetical protein DSUL_50340 [Desulfovibrionales bacterium]